MKTVGKVAAFVQDNRCLILSRGRNLSVTVSRQVWDLHSFLSVGYWGLCFQHQVALRDLILNVFIS